MEKVAIKQIEEKSLASGVLQSGDIIRSITSTGPFIDSVACPDGEINNVNKANLIIFLHNE